MVEASPNKKRVAIIIVLIDGIADYNNEAHQEGGARKTCLEEARIPNLDALASSKDAYYGLHDPV
jgi:2,3-bisphosphoglycerate-independent phosphoglycerate mutase